jgi:hypothetical protein
VSLAAGRAGENAREAIRVRDAADHATETIQTWLARGLFALLAITIALLLAGAILTRVRRR